MATVIALTLLPILSPQEASATTFANATAITGAKGTVPCGNGNGYVLPTPYPSNISVSGLSGTISSLSLKLHNASGFGGDFDILLVGPAGQKFVPLSDAGSTDGTNITLTLSDEASSTLASGGSWGANGSSVSSKPVNYNAGNDDAFPSPAPNSPYISPAPTGTASFASVFNGTNPNGTWSLYLTDDCVDLPDSAINGGWSLDITTAAAVSSTTTLTSSNNPSFTGSNVTFTAHVAKTSDGSNVAEGTVTFKEGATTLASNVAVDASGNAAFTTSALSEGAHSIQAFFNGTANFATSNGTVTQVVDNSTTVNDNSYCNNGNVAINDPPGPSSRGTATPYPSRIFVSNLGGAISNVTLSLKNVSHVFEDDIDVILEGPGGQKFVVVSDAGGGSPPGTSVSNVSTTFSDAAASTIGDDSGGWGSPGSSVSWRPTNHESPDTFPSPAPSSPASPSPIGSASFSSVFGGADPNGTWRLFVVDDSQGDTGSIAGGWCLTFTTTNDPATTTDLSSSQNPSFTGDSVTFTAHVVRTDNGNDVGSGSVTFKDGNTVLANSVPLNANGIATFTTNSLAEGTHALSASYSGSPGQFNLSSDTLDQEVNDRTVITGNSFCNTGNIPVNDPAGAGLFGKATPYPSRVFVSDISGSIAKVRVKLKNVTHSVADDMDVLLVGPGGHSLVVVSDAGGGSPPNTATNNVTVTFDDSAGSSIGDTLGGWGSTGSSTTSQPVDYADGSDTFPQPAPTGPHGTPAPAGTGTFASTFNGLNPNGTWSLYVVDDTLGDEGSFAQGWCLELSIPPTADDDSYTAGKNTQLSVDAPGVLADDGGFPSPSAQPMTEATDEDGSVTLDSDGSFVYTPPSDFVGEDGFTYTVSNGSGATDTAEVTIAVTQQPTISGSTIGRTQGSGETTSQIATVDDAETAAGDLSVEATPPSGVTVTDVSNNEGTVSARVDASCTATTGSNLVPLEVTDGDGFTGTGTLTVNVVGNTPPSLSYEDDEMTVGEGGSIDPLSGPSDNGSVTALDVQSVSPAGFTGTIGVAGPSAEHPARVSVADAGPAGDYVVSVRATDNCGGTTDAIFDLEVLPPNTTPTADAGGDYEIDEGEALVLDASGSSDVDGDVLSYKWDLDDDGSFDDASGVDPTLTWQELVGLGLDDGPSTHPVDVEVSDGKAAGTAIGTSSLLIGNSPPVVEIGGAGDALVNQAETFTVSASDDSPNDEAAGFDYTIDWGDGTVPDQVEDVPTAQIEHTFEQIGTYKIVVTAFDKDGAQSSLSSLNVTIAGLMAVNNPCGSGQTAFVGGTSGDDRIRLRGSSSEDSIRAFLNGQSLGSVIAREAVIYGHNGADEVFVSRTGIPRRVIYGNGGRDKVIGSKGAMGQDVLLGGPSRDVLVGRTSRDILIGGQGRDRLRGGPQEDILVSGGTSFVDSSESLLEAVCRLRAEWNRSDLAYKGRRNHLAGSVPGGLNGLTFLTNAPPSPTVFDDSRFDSLIGGRGRDWFFLNQNGTGQLDDSDHEDWESSVDL